MARLVDYESSSNSRIVILWRRLAPESFHYCFGSGANFRKYEQGTLWSLGGMYLVP